MSSPLAIEQAGTKTGDVRTRRSAEKAASRRRSKDMASPPADSSKKKAPKLRTKKDTPRKTAAAIGDRPLGTAKKGAAQQARTKQNSAVKRGSVPKKTVRRDTAKRSVPRAPAKKTTASRPPSIKAAPPRTPKKTALPPGARKKRAPLGRTPKSTASRTRTRSVVPKFVSPGERKLNALLDRVGNKRIVGTAAQKRAAITRLQKLVVILQQRKAQLDEERAREALASKALARKPLGRKRLARESLIHEAPDAEATQTLGQETSHTDRRAHSPETRVQARPDQQRDRAKQSRTRQSPAAKASTAPRRGRGRPLKLTERKQEEFFELIDSGLTRSRAAKMIGCVPSTISKALERDASFRKRLRRTERIAEGMRLKRMYILAPRRHRRHIERLRDIFRSRLRVGPASRRFEHRLQIALLRLAALKLRHHLDA